VFPENHTVWENDLVPVGAARAWLNAGIITKDAPFMTEAYKAEWLAWMSSPNAIEAGLNCYRSQLRGINDADERNLTDADRTLHVPVLAVGGRYDPIARAEIQIETTRAWAAGGFESVTLDGGHWLSIEKADEVSQLLLEFGGK
jgi:soluble epoxide hydrolase / lipid-phosphate phosphatase